MGWFEAFAEDRQPSFEEIASYIASPHWQALGAFLQETYHVSPKMNYSGCSGQPGWNVKYQKSGKSLCTLYPMEGYFIALVVVGEKEKQAAELLLPSLSAYTQEVYGKAAALMGAKWLMLSVTEETILQDVKSLIGLRVKPRPVAEKS